MVIRNYSLRQFNFNPLFETCLFQPPKSVLAQVHLHPNVPIHTISFNCADKDANEFLCHLAKDTGGRFHYYAENGIDFDGPEPWESEDIRLLKQEYESGLLNLDKIATLRDECAALAWKKDTDFSGNSRKCSRSGVLCQGQQVKVKYAL